MSEVLASIAGQLGDGSGVFPRPGGVWAVGPPTDQDQQIEVINVPQGDAAEWVDLYAVAASTSVAVATHRDRVVMKDTPTGIRRVRELHERLIAARPQYACDVLFVELSDSAAETLGIDWDVGGNLGIAAGTEGFVGDALFEAVARFAANKSASRSRVVSRQRLHLIEGGSATMQVGDSVPVPERVVSSEGTVATSGYTVIDTGVLLTVSARGADNGRVVLDLDPEVSTISRYVEGLPVISRRALTSSAVMTPGDTIVLGGLSEQQQAEERQGLPRVSLFDQRRRSDDRRRLFVIVRLTAVG